MIMIIRELFFFQTTSYYGLLSTTAIPALVPTGQMISLPFYSGCRYAAIPARSTQEVMHLKKIEIHFYPWLRLIRLPVQLNYI